MVSQLSQDQLKLTPAASVIETNMTHCLHSWKHLIGALVFIVALAGTSQCNAAQEALRNFAPGAPVISNPDLGWSAMLPNGDRTVIVETLPNGDFRTQIGVILSPEGIARNGAFAGQKALLERSDSHIERNDVVIDKSLFLKEGQNFTLQNGVKGQIAERTPNGDFHTNLGFSLSPDGVVLNGEFKGQKAAADQSGAHASDWRKTPKKARVQTEPGKSGWRDLPRKTQPGTTAAIPDNVAVPVQTRPGTPASPSRSFQETPEITIADLLPRTSLPPASASSPRTAKAPNSPSRSPSSVKIGETLGIPQEAAASGDASFLEGCWHVVNPTGIVSDTSCYCFDAQGAGQRIMAPNGASRVTCNGPSQAKIDQNGNLWFSASTLNCSNGGTINGYQFVCRNNGAQAICRYIVPGVKGNAGPRHDGMLTRVQSCSR